MGLVEVSTENIVEHLAKDVKFLQPVYETITNSLEANAKNIVIEFFIAPCLNGVEPNIAGFKVTDDGDGFNKTNREAFCQLWTKNKVKLGCKGSGRFTWLSVYEKINIISEVKEEQNEVIIPFSVNFEPKRIVTTLKPISENLTIIEFSNVTSRFFDLSENIDKRAIANLTQIKDSILEYLLIKLFLLKRDGCQFNIELILGSQREIINIDNIPNLLSKKFNVSSDITNQTYEFELFYRFIKDNKNSKKVFYCANSRATKAMDDDALGFSCGLPNRDSFMMLLCSSYFDDKDNDSRDDLTALSNLNQPTLSIPLLYSDINPYMKRAMHQAILDEYPEIKIINQYEEEKALNIAPHLSFLIKKDTDIVKSQKSLLIKANKEFALAKERARDNFVRVLKSKKINDDDFQKAIERLSLVASAELGEYVLYRESIISALNEAISDKDKKERFIHDIFMPMKTAAQADDEDKHLLSNLWLLDDKFMSYAFAASDKTINQIAEEIFTADTFKYKSATRPDLSIFYNRKEGNKDVVMVEFKGLNAPLDEKTKSLTELPRDIAILRKNFDSINMIWGYIITNIDNEFKLNIESGEEYKELFVADSDVPMYYKFFPKSRAHIYIVDVRSITSDALARNKTFLDILKKQ